jgi:hypothetical protein
VASWWVWLSSFLSLSSRQCCREPE